MTKDSLHHDVASLEYRPVLAAASCSWFFADTSGLFVDTSGLFVDAGGFADVSGLFVDHRHGAERRWQFQSDAEEIA